MSESYFKTLIKNPRVALTFYYATGVMQKVEREIKLEVSRTTLPVQDIIFPHLELSLKNYFQRNFFSILFITIYQSLNFDEKKIWNYTKVLHFIRGIVTATDNVIDGEDKGAIRINLKHGKVLPQVLSMLLQQGQLFLALNELAKGDEKKVKDSLHAILKSFWDLGAEESQEEDGIHEILPPQRIIEEIHEFRGARLLALAFIVPEVMEADPQGEIQTMIKAVKKIGLSLQVLDDVCDLEQDLKENNHNYLLSLIKHHEIENVWGRKSIAAMLELHSGRAQDAFAKETHQACNFAIDMALQGFSLMHEAGHPLGPESAKELLQTLFELRGLKDLWDFSVNTLENQPTDRGIESAHTSL